MIYQSTIPLSGDPAKALNTLRQVFIQQGFTLTDTGRAEFEVAGPGWQSTRQSALRGVSHARVSAAGREISVEAELGGARNLQRFVRFFPPLLMLGLCVVLFVVFYFTMPARGLKTAVKVIALVGGINLALWIPLGMFWAPAIRRATVRSLDTLLANAAACSKS